MSECNDTYVAFGAMPWVAIFTFVRAVFLEEFGQSLEPQILMEVNLKCGTARDIDYNVRGGKGSLRLPFFPTAKYHQVRREMLLALLMKLSRGMGTNSHHQKTSVATI